MNEFYKYHPSEVKECNRCLFTNEITHIGDDGECEYCKLHDELEKNASGSWVFELERIKKAGRGKKYNCLIGISGGLDSSLLLYMAVVYWGLRPLVIHFNNGYNTKAASRNMKRLIDNLNVDFIMYRVNKFEYDTLNEAFLEAGVPDADIPNDIAMAKLMYETAKAHGIKTILNGHCFRTEGSTPKLWTRMDAEYIKAVYEDHTGDTLHNFPLYTFWDQVWQGIKGIRQVRPYHYKSVFDLRADLEKEMKENVDWVDYGGKHSENRYTEFVGAMLLPVKFGIDKRIVYLSARVRSGLIGKEESRKILSEPPVFDATKYPDWATGYVYDDHINNREWYHLFNFKKYSFLIWILSRLGVVPHTFYKKYC